MLETCVIYAQTLSLPEVLRKKEKRRREGRKKKKEETRLFCTVVKAGKPNMSLVDSVLIKSSLDHREGQHPGPQKCCFLVHKDPISCSTKRACFLVHRSRTFWSTEVLLPSPQKSWSTEILLLGSQRLFLGPQKAYVFLHVHMA